MFTKTTGLFIVPTWLTAMCWLVAHDVWPHFAARDLPRVQPSSWLREEGKRSQFEIYHKGIHIGTIWTIHNVGEKTVSRDDLIWLEQPTFLSDPLRATIYSTYSQDGLLDEFTFQFENNRVGNFELHGERFPLDFSFELKRGPLKNAFKISLVDGGMVTDTLSPFGELGELHVGQTWKMQLFNPVTAITGVGDKFTSVLVKVVGQEKCSSPEGVVSCFVVEAANATAWVDEHGSVLSQEVEVPLMGNIRINRSLTFDEVRRNEILQLNLKQCQEASP